LNRLELDLNDLVVEFIDDFSDRKEGDFKEGKLFSGLTMIPALAVYSGL